MTVSELIKELQKFDPNMRVVLCAPDCEALEPVPEVQALVPGEFTGADYCRQLDEDGLEHNEKVVAL